MVSSPSKKRAKQDGPAAATGRRCLVEALLGAATGVHSPAPAWADSANNFWLGPLPGARRNFAMTRSTLKRQATAIYVNVRGWNNWNMEGGH
jgi:hypothetical protein